MTTQTLYNTDFYAWIQEQATFLRQEELEKLDLPNLLEEIEDMARSQRRELTSRLTVLIAHLLKWQIQVEHQSRSWAGTIRTQRREINLLLRDSPSLRREIPDHIVDAYPGACDIAIQETGLLNPHFPPTCPYTIQQILDPDFFPASP